MCDQGIDLGCSFFLQQFCGSRNCVRCIGQVIDEDTCFPFDIAYKHHGCILAIRDTGWAPFLGDMSLRKSRVRGSITLWINAKSMLRSSAIAVALFAPP